MVMPVGQDSFDVRHQPRPTVRPVWGSQPPDDPNITSYAADVELQNYLDVSAQETPSDVGVALHSSTPSSLSPHQAAVLSVRNVKWIGSHRPIGKLESLADKIAADSAISSDPSLDSAVTPGVILPWFQFDGQHVSRFSHDFYGGGMLAQRLLPPRPVYSMKSSLGPDGMGVSRLDGYVSDGDHSYRRDWDGFKTAPSVRRLLTFPSHCVWHPLPGLFPIIDSPELKFGSRTYTGGFIKSDRTFRLTMMNNRAFSCHLMFRTEDDVSFTFVTPGTRVMISWSGFWVSVPAGGLATLGRDRYTTRRLISSLVRSRTCSRRFGMLIGVVNSHRPSHFLRLERGY